MDRRTTSAAWGDALQGVVRTLRSAGARSADSWQRSLEAAPFAGLGSTYARLLREGAVPYGREVVGLTASYYRGLAEAAQSYLELVADELSDGAPSPTSVHPVEVVQLHGRAGATVTTTFTVTNGDPSLARVAISAGTCRSADGEGFAAPLEIRPATVDLSPGGEVEVEVRLALDPELFNAGTTYRIPIHVDGPRSSTVQLAVSVDDET